jgi:hypothetical protein
MANPIICSFFNLSNPLAPLSHNLIESMYQTSPSFSLFLFPSFHRIVTPFSFLTFLESNPQNISLFANPFSFSFILFPFLPPFIFSLSLSVSFILDESSYTLLSLWTRFLDLSLSPSFSLLLILVESSYTSLFLSLLCTYKSTTKAEDIPCVEKQNHTWKKALRRPHTTTSM